MGTRYFTADTLDFLQDLEVHNERDWFKTSQARYEDVVRSPMLAFITDLAAPLHAQLSPHLVADPRKVGGSLFRIQRDVRFSHDKSPYKTNTGAFMRHELGKEIAGAPGVYLHVEPGNCFMGAGVHRPPSAALRQLRTAMVDAPDEWTTARDAIASTPWTWGGDSLIRAPKGFDADHPLIEDLRRKSFILRRPITERQITSTTILDHFVDRATETLPLLGWLCRSLHLPF